MSLRNSSSGSQGIDLRQRYRVECACGNWLEGNRRKKQSSVICPECGQAAFVLPPDVYPEVAVAERIPDVLSPSDEQPLELMPPRSDPGSPGKRAGDFESGSQDAEQPPAADSVEDDDLSENRLGDDEIDASLGLSKSSPPPAPLDVIELDDDELDDDSAQDAGPTYSLSTPPPVDEPVSPPPPPPPVRPSRKDSDPDLNLDAALGFGDSDDLFEEQDDEPEFIEILPEQRSGSDRSGGGREDLESSDEDSPDDSKPAAVASGASRATQVAGETEDPDEQFWSGQVSQPKRPMYGRRRFQLILAGIVLVVMATMGVSYWNGRKQQAIEDFRTARQQGFDAIEQRKWVEAEESFAQAIAAAEWFAEGDVDRQLVQQYYQETHARTELSSFSLLEVLRKAELDAEVGVDPSATIVQDLGKAWLIFDCDVHCVETAAGPAYRVEFPLLVGERMVSLESSSEVFEQFVGTRVGDSRRVVFATTLAGGAVAEGEWKLELDDTALFLWCFARTLPILDDLPEGDEDRESIQGVLRDQAEFKQLDAEFDR